MAKASWLEAGELEFEWKWWKRALKEQTRACARAHAHTQAEAQSEGVEEWMKKEKRKKEAHKKRMIEKGTERERWDRMYREREQRNECKISKKIK